MEKSRADELRKAARKAAARIIMIMRGNARDIPEDEEFKEVLYRQGWE